MSEQKTATLVERLAQIPYTGAVSDILDEMGYHDQVLPHEIQSLHPGHVVVGKALTILGEPTDSTDPEVIFVPFLKMLGDVKPDNVLVNQPNDSLAAHLGELSAETAQYRGARDTEYIRKLGFPVFARYKTPVDIVGRWSLVAHNVPIVIGRVHIAPGDYILGDRDGVLVIPQSIVAEVVTQAEAVVQTENLVRKSILEGTHPVDAFRKFGRF
jgi:4-hydroxy-4-methyl-2-oxoglutarate aldolase